MTTQRQGGVARLVRALGLSCLVGGPAAAQTMQIIGPPVSFGSSPYPTIGTWHYSATSAIVATTVGAKTGLFGVAAKDATVNWPNSYIGGLDTLDQTSVYSISPGGGIAISANTRSSDSPYSTPHDVIAESVVAVQDNATVPHLTWGRYTLGVVKAGAASAHFLGHEMSMINEKATAGMEDPFTPNPTDSASLLRLDNGVGAGTSNTLSSALDIVNNGGKFYQGIVVTNGALDTTAVAHPAAVALPAGYSIASWYTAAGTIGNQIYADGSKNLFFTREPGVNLASLTPNGQLQVLNGDATGASAHFSNQPSGFIQVAGTGAAIFGYNSTGGNVTVGAGAGKGFQLYVNGTDGSLSSGSLALSITPANFVTFSGALRASGGLQTGIATALVTSSVAMNSGAGSATGTITNAPIAGNPTKWIPINDNGTTRYIPVW